MTTAIQRKAAKRARRPIYLTPMRLVDPTDGVSYAAFVPAHAIDQRIARERKFAIGHTYRAEIKQARNVKFHRLAHALGQMLVDNVDGFDALNAHDAIKRVQREAGVCCEEIEIDLPGYGKLLAKQAESLAFDEMTPERFAEFFDGITNYIDVTYSPDFTSDARAEYFLMVAGEQR